MNRRNSITSHNTHATHDHDNRPRSHSVLKDITKDVNFGEDIDLVVGVTATALTADQLLKLANSKDHKAMHLAKAGLSVAVATTAFTMLAREHEEHKKREKADALARGRQLDREYDQDVESNYSVRSGRRSRSSSQDNKMALVPSRSPRRGSSAYQNHPYRIRSRSRSSSSSPPRRRAGSRLSSPARPRYRERSKSPPSLVRMVEGVVENLTSGGHRR